MKTFVILFLLSFNFLAIAKQLSWYEGAIVLMGDQVLTGQFSIDLHHDVILFRNKEAFMVYPAHHVKSFQYYDVEANINRKFMSLKDDHIVFNIYHLYEIVVRGNISVLRRQKVDLTYESTNHDKFDYEYYIMYNNQLTSLMRFRSKVYPELLKNLRQDVLRYIREKRLNPNQPACAIQIIEFYNKHEKLTTLAGNY